jgi:non-heme chloroperoxidase
MLGKWCAGVVLCGCFAMCANAAKVESGTFTTSDGVKLHYLEAGKGPAIVFVPGWTMPAWIWEGQIQHFSEHYHVVALDPRSQGESEKAAEGNYIERRAQDIHELIESRKLGPVVLVGWSLAVAEVLSYAEQFGGANVRGYVLVDGLAWERQDLQFVEAMLGMFKQLQVNRRPFTERFVRSMYKKPQSEEYIARVIAASLQMPTDSAVVASLSAVSRTDWKPAIAKLDRPVLVMCESSIQAMTADPIKKNVPTAQVEVFADAGHALFVDDAERFNSALEDFVKSLPAQ